MRARAELFLDNGVTGDILDLISPDILGASFGVTDVLHQRSIMAGIRFLKACEYDINGVIKPLRSAVDVSRAPLCTCCVACARGDCCCARSAADIRVPA